MLSSGSADDQRKGFAGQREIVSTTCGSGWVNEYESKEGSVIMSLTKLVLGMLVLWLSLMGIVSGFLCLLCLILVVLWQGLGVSTLILALVCLFCLGLAVILAGRAATVAHRPPGKRHNWGLAKRWWQSLNSRASVVPTIEQADKTWQEEVRGYGKWSPEAGDEHY